MTNRNLNGFNETQQQNRSTHVRLSRKSATSPLPNVNSSKTQLNNYTRTVYSEQAGLVSVTVVCRKHCNVYSKGRFSALKPSIFNKTVKGSRFYDRCKRKVCNSVMREHTPFWQYSALRLRADWPAYIT